MSKGDISEIAREYGREETAEAFKRQVAERLERQAGPAESSCVRDETQSGDNSFKSFNSSAHQEKRKFPQLDPAVFHGVIGRIVKAIEPFTEADPAAVLVQLLAGFGNIIGRSPFFIADSQPHRTNLFVCIVGQSAKARKGTALGCARYVLRQLDEAWDETRVMSGTSSGEGLIWQVRDPIEKKVARKERGKFSGEYDTVIEDHGVDDRRLFVAQTEFAQTFAV